MKLPALLLSASSLSAVSTSVWSAGWMEFPIERSDFFSPLVIAILFFALSALVYLQGAFRRGIGPAALALLIVAGVISGAVLLPRSADLVLFGGVAVIFTMLIVGMMSTLRTSK